MPEYPLLPLPESEPGTSRARPGGQPPAPELSPERQTQRLGPTFNRLQRALEQDPQGLSLRDDPSGIAPERALVLEVVGPLADFQALARRVDGLEFLADEETEVTPDGDFHELDTRKGKEGGHRTDRPLGGRLYIAMPDGKALRELLSLWGRWQRGENLPRGLASWRTLFERLRAIRPWGPEDRLSDQTISLWRDAIEPDPDALLRIEAELWFRENELHRAAAYRRFLEAVKEADGKVIDHAVINEIGYEAVLIDVPCSEIARLVHREGVHLAVCDDIMFLRPQSSTDMPEPGDDIDAESVVPDDPPTALPPVAALFDGVPVQNHVLLEGRLEMDDPDGLEAMSVVASREHGTAMASLILHGDRNIPGHALSRRLYMRPILYAPEDGPEKPRRDRLLIDVFHQAVRRMKEGDHEGGATAPEVFLVNLSVCDPRRPFSGPMSPWARLLDHLADRYGILFLVSAGNIRTPLPVDEFSGWTGFEDSEPEDRERAVLQALSRNKAYRTLLSPAEALNVVTVGAMHDDEVTGSRGSMAIDPYEARELPNVSSAMGLGHRKAIKPDIHLPGGREHLRFHQSGAGALAVIPGGRSGLLAASPGPADNRTRLTPGTSAATALATRSAHLIFDALMDVDGGSMHESMDPQYRAVVVKALLVHRAKWGNRAASLEELCGPHGKGKHIERRDNVSRLLGYGFPDIAEALSCAPNRATLVGYGTIAARTTNIHRIPLPHSLERVTEPRALAVTVAWFSPVNRLHGAYRRAKLEVSSEEDIKTVAGAGRSGEQPSHVSVQRGTVTHILYEGADAVPFVDDGHVLLRIDCREQAGALDRNIHYGVAVTIEAGVGIPVYAEVRARLGIRVGVP